MTNTLKLKCNQIKFSLNELYACLQKLEFYAANKYDHIYDVCNKLKRLVQLDKEETLITLEYSNDDMKSYNLNRQFEDLFGTIEKYEKETLQKQNKIKRQNLHSLIREFKLFFEIFFNYWSNVNEESVDLHKLKKAYNHIEKYRHAIDSFINDLIEVNFNNNLIMIKETEKTIDNHLRYRIIFKQVFKYNPSTSHNFNQVVDYFKANLFVHELDCFKCDQFENETYLVAAAIPCAHKSLCIIFDPDRKKIIKKACFENKLDRKSVV